MTQIDNGSDVKVIAPVLCTLTLMIVALIAFRKQLAVKIKIILRSRSRSDDDSSDASDVDHDGVLHSVESAGVTYSLRSLGGYTAETVLSGELRVCHLKVSYHHRNIHNELNRIISSELVLISHRILKSSLHLCVILSALRHVV